MDLFVGHIMLAEVVRTAFGGLGNAELAARRTSSYEC